MTVKELKVVLENLPEDDFVAIIDDNDIMLPLILKPALYNSSRIVQIMLPKEYICLYKPTQ